VRVSQLRMGDIEASGGNRNWPGVWWFQVFNIGPHIAIRHVWLWHAGRSDKGDVEWVCGLIAWSFLGVLVFFGFFFGFTKTLTKNYKREQKMKGANVQRTDRGKIIKKKRLLGTIVVKGGPGGGFRGGKKGEGVNHTSWQGRGE